MTQVAVTLGTRIPLVSTCPNCGYSQTQWYSQLALQIRLRRGHPVEGYCVLCEDFWQLSGHERANLAVRLAD